MNTSKQYTGLVVLLCAALAACSSDRADRMSSATESSSGATGSSYASDTSAPGPSTSATRQASSYGTVQSIEPGARQDIGVGTLGGAAAGGAMGAPNDQVYRVTVRMDDGSTQTIVLDNMPNYKSGDRVRYSNGTLQRTTQ